MSKPRVIKDYDKLDLAVQQKLKLEYPYGFDKDLISFQNHKGKFVSALPYEDDDSYYLVRMTKEQAHEIITEDSDYDEDGNLKEDAIETLEESLEEVPEPSAEEMDD